MPPRPKKRSTFNKFAGLPLFEMQKSSYLFQETTSLLLCLISCIISWQYTHRIYGFHITLIVFAFLFHVIWFIAAISFRPKLSKPHCSWFKMKHKVPVFKEKVIKTKDGCYLKYYISQTVNKKTHKQIICLAPPLGQCGYSIYNPLLAHLGTDEYIFVSFDYRGFFGSTRCENAGKKIRSISIHQFATDINEILTFECILCIDYIVGHSLGVQVALEFVVSFPDKINSLILLNGSHGTVFNTALQPILRLPFIGDLVSEFFAFMVNNPYFLEFARYYLLSPLIRYSLKVYVKIFGSPLLQQISGEDYLYEFFENYLNGICDCNESLYHYIRAFQELHSHSVYHLLDKIQHPTLIISGLWDLLLPCLSSFEMARKLPNARHCCDIYSSHATILENPESCVYEIVSFINSTQKNKTSNFYKAKRSKMSNAI